MEKRDTIRVPFHARALIRHDVHDIEGEVSSLSTAGIFLKTAVTPTAGSTIEINLFLYGSSSQLILNLRGTVSRIEPSGMAITFVDVDPDAFMHLRNIMAAGAFDEDKIVRDFEADPIDQSIHD